MDQHAGCPKCARDLVLANPHKESVRMPNGFLTFRDLRVGERLWLPDKWFSAEFERLPPAYFKSLPSADGVTPSTLGDAADGVLGDFAALDAAGAKLAALAGMTDAQFSAAAPGVGSAIDAANQEAYGSPNAAAAAHAKDAHDGTQWAWQRNGELATALAGGDANGAKAARLDIQNALTTALGNARLALEAYYAQPPQAPASAAAPSSAVSASPQLASAAQAVVAAIAADAGYCSSVARAGSAVNGAVHAFKLAWNAEQAPPVPVGTGNYEQATADAVARVLGSAPRACGAGGHAPSLAAMVPAASAPSATRLSPMAILGVGALAAGALAGMAYLARSHHPARAARPHSRRRR